MLSNNQKTKLNKLIKNFNFSGSKKYKLIVLLGLLGDFDSFEYAINLKNFIKNNEQQNIDIFAIAIGSKIGKGKFCKFTGFPKKNLVVVCDNEIHQDLMVSKGVDIGLGGWINMLIMLSGINSLKTIKEVIRGYTGDRNSKQIFSDQDQINLLDIIKFSGVFFKYTCGDGYLRPFELATYRLNNMIEIFQNWNDYILDNKYLPQRGASFLLDDKDQIIYDYFANDVLGYSSKMEDPIAFLSENCR
ncbi:AhpC/TSA family protein [Prochlorococcus sp. AH-716-E13]|nr:AhpC/TSA family protein [Prochlorococcus sp. AH-716-E13]